MNKTTTVRLNDGTYKYYNGWQDPNKIIRKYDHTKWIDHMLDNVSVHTYFISAIRKEVIKYSKEVNSND